MMRTGRREFRTRDWSALVPSWEAAAQFRWERIGAARRMRRAGLTWEEIGERLNVTASRARQVSKQTLEEISPVEQYLSGDNIELAEIVRRMNNHRRAGADIVGALVAAAETFNNKVNNSEFLSFVAFLIRRAQWAFRAMEKRQP